MDTMTISLSNITAFLKQDNNLILVDPSAIEVHVTRPLTANANHHIPNALVQIDIKKIGINFKEDMLPLFFGILSGNMAEPVSPDEKELKMVTDGLEIDPEVWRRFVSAEVSSITKK